MRRAVIGAMAVVFMMTALSGCDLWWSATVNKPGGPLYGRSACTISTYPASTPGSQSGWVRERVDYAERWNGIDRWLTTGLDIRGDVAWIYMSGLGNHTYPSDNFLWGSASAGDKVIVGIYPGETFQMGFYGGSGNATNVLLRARVVDGLNNVLNSQSNCEQVQA